MIPRFHPILLGTALTLAPLTAGAQAAADPPPVAGVTEISVGQTAGQMYVPVDKSELLRVEHAFRDIRVGNRDIAEVQPLSKGVVYVLGKKYGTTNLTLRDSSGAVVAVIDVVVTYDIDGLKRQIRELFPNEHVDVTGSGDAIALSGAVSSSDQLRQILALADHYAPGKVANLLSLGGSQQVLLEVKFCEVQRSALKNIDANANLNYASGGDVINSGSGPVFSGTPGGVDPTKAFGAITGVFTHGLWTTSAGFEALENKGIIRTLAEPNLVALSGDTANFLAGGEIPIPVQTTQAGAGGYPTVTLEYKDYGVGLSFTPTIIGKQLVNLAMISEVSSIDNSQAFKENGFSIPALKVRRAKTTVEMRDGQSFAIAGLLQDDFANATQEIPGLGNLPILGALFRSVNYQHNQSDLVLIITVHLIQPTVAKNLSTPLDSLVLPSEADHFANGTVEKNDADPAPQPGKQGFVLP